MHVLLISTYELGRQPVHIASPAAALRSAGHSVESIDLAVEALMEEHLDGVDAVAISVPMHTAMRLAVATARRIRGDRPRLPIALYGLYAAVGAEETLGIPIDRLIAGEYEPELVKWAGGLSNGHRVTVDVGKTDFEVPDRSGLPPLANYARLEWDGIARVAAAVEASHGCRHRCRHCPIPVLYDGRMRVVGAETVLADISQLVASGVEHVTFGDPDFLNAPAYSAAILERAHQRFPHISFDATVKVSHVLQHRDIWADLAGNGLLFVVSAFESMQERTLRILDKNHTVADMRRAVSTLGDSGIFVRPTWLPFFPWTTPADLADLVGFLDEMRLWEATDPVQLAIKLLVPQGSLLETHPEVEPHLAYYDPAALTWRWDFVDQTTGDLFDRLDTIAAEASDCDAETATTLAAMREAIGGAAGIDLGPLPWSGAPVPRLSESWFCCAEPTSGQAAAVGLNIGRVLAK